MEARLQPAPITLQVREVHFPAKSFGDKGPRRHQFLAFYAYNLRDFTTETTEESATASAGENVTRQSESDVAMQRKIDTRFALGEPLSINRCDLWW